MTYDKQAMIKMALTACSSSSLSSQSSRTTALAPRDSRSADADYLVAHPRMERDLHSGGVPHRPVRVRDSTGPVGPLVISGVTAA
jgi:hypothetical protein